MRRRKISSGGLVLPLATALFCGCLIGDTLRIHLYFMLTGLLLAGLYLLYGIYARRHEHPRAYALCLLCFAVLGMESREACSGKPPESGATIALKETAAGLNADICARIDTLVHTHSIDSVYAAQTASVLKALLMGDKSGISREMKKNFRLSGTIHLLALSGLHVGIIYLFISLAFFYIPDLGIWKRVKGILILLAVWGFAFITGMSVSTLRAALFISLREIGKMTFRSPSGADVLGTTAMILLIFSPSLSDDLGFQMSFAAVAGIILLVSPVNRYLKDRKAGIQQSIHLKENWNGKLKKVCSTLVQWGYSLCANTVTTCICQLTSGSIALYHFRTYPAHFLAANLLAIPAATVSVFAGMVLLTLGWIPPVGSISCIVLNISIMCMEKAAGFFA